MAVKTEHLAGRPSGHWQWPYCAERSLGQRPSPRPFPRRASAPWPNPPASPAKAEYSRRVPDLVVTGVLGALAAIADMIFAPYRLERCPGTAEFIDQRRSTSDDPGPRLLRPEDRNRETREGQNQWPAVHRLDAGPLYRRRSKKGPGGRMQSRRRRTRRRFKDIAAVIGRQSSVPRICSRVWNERHFNA